jgi:hypothetical protein
MNMLDIKAFGGLLLLMLAMAALLFIPAWTFDYWQAWIFLAVYFVPSLATTSKRTVRKTVNLPRYRMLKTV